MYIYQLGKQTVTTAWLILPNGIRKGYWLMTIGVIAMLAFLFCIVGIKYYVLRLEIAFADDQIEFFDRMRAKSLHAKPNEAACNLEQVVAYYPSGTKQEHGSRLDRIVEKARNDTIRDIIAYLKTKLGMDLGDDPHAWIEHCRQNQFAE